MDEICLFFMILCYLTMIKEKSYKKIIGISFHTCAHTKSKSSIEKTLGFYNRLFAHVHHHAIL